MFTWTDEPYRALWDHLLFLKHEANVRNLLAGRMKSGRRFSVRESPLLETKARQISRSIAQAHEYYIAADAVTLATSPLLYFYGMLSLAKAVVVANDIDMSLDDIRYHGLHTRPRSDELRRYSEDASSHNLDQEFAIVSGGVFPELTKTTMGFRLPDDSAIRLGDVLRVDPELHGLITKLHQRAPGSASAGSAECQNGIFSLNLSRSNKEEVSQGFEEIDKFFDVRENGNGRGIRLVSHAGTSPFERRFGYYKVLSGGNYFVDGLRFVSNGAEDKRYIRPEICDYVGMFILSTCVRYKQEFWSEVLEGRKSGSAAVVQRFVHVSRRRYPNFILDSVFGEHFDYGIAGRMI